jgi:hypothetical protein
MGPALDLLFSILLLLPCQKGKRDRSHRATNGQSCPNHVSNEREAAQVATATHLFAYIVLFLSARAGSTAITKEVYASKAGLLLLPANASRTKSSFKRKKRMQLNGATAIIAERIEYSAKRTSSTMVHLRAEFHTKMLTCKVREHNCLSITCKWRTLQWPCNCKITIEKIETSN